MLTNKSLLTAGLVVLAVAAGPAATAQESTDLGVEASIADRELSRVDANDPLQLRPEEEAVVEVTVRNDGEESVTVRSVRLDGRVLGLTFFTFTTRVDLVVPPGEVGDRRYSLDLGDLGEQATGLMPARLSLLDQDREVLVTEEFPVDVRGSMMSVYAVFALGVAAVSALLLLGLVVRLLAGLLPTNRWSRAVRFATPGAGLGLTLAFTASALRIAVPSPRVAVTAIVVGTLGGFVAGYLSPRRAELSYDLEERDLVPQDASTQVGQPPRLLDLRDASDVDGKRAPVPAQGPAPATLPPRAAHDREHR